MATRRKGISAPSWVADFIRPWWPRAEAVTIGVRGTDIIRTPGIAWEVKTANEFRPNTFVKQAKSHAGSAQIPVVVYIPNGCGPANVEYALAILPLHRLVDILDDGGYTQKPKDPATSSEAS